jgi:ribonucleoside-diphosphate reductase alpha chain
LLDGGFVKHGGVLTSETKDIILQFGLRNSALSAIAPNGTLAIVAGNVSGGLEPVFSTEYSRWKRVESDMVAFTYPNVQKGEWFETDYFKEMQIADESVLMSTDNQYRIDKNTGLCKKASVIDYGYKMACEYGKDEFTTANALTINEHLDMLALFGKYIDQSCSKTINLPNDITFSEFKALYDNIHKLGIKGCTTYREGTSVAVLEAEKKQKEVSIKKQHEEFLNAFKDHNNGDVVFQSVKLPEEYPAKGYILRSEGKKWYLHVCFKDQALTKPFAIFVNTNNREDNVVTFNALEKMEEIALSKGLNQDLVEETKRKYAYQKNPVKICRMLGLLLRHNIDVYTIVKGFNELGGAVPGTFVFRMKKFLGQFVQDHDIIGMACPDCHEKSIVFSEGCVRCTSCSWSKCG